MSIRNIVINGSNKPTSATSPIEALEEFYFAFNHQDLETMNHNWLQSPKASMSNPLGGIKRGWNEIQAVYARIFTGTARVYVEYYDIEIMQTDAMFCAVGHERGWFRKDDEEIELAIRTSRIYQIENNRWCQLHHHGSIDDPVLLARYQMAVMPKPGQRTNS